MRTRNEKQFWLNIRRLYTNKRCDFLMEITSVRSFFEYYISNKQNFTYIKDTFKEYLEYIKENKLVDADYELSCCHHSYDYVYMCGNSDNSPSGQKHATYTKLLNIRPDNIFWTRIADINEDVYLGYIDFMLNKNENVERHTPNRNRRRGNTNN